MLLSVPLPALNRVGKNTAQSLKKLGLETVQDLLLYFPFRYDDFSQTTSIDKIEAGQNISITGTIELIQNKRSVKQRRQLTEALISDDSGLIKVCLLYTSDAADDLLCVDLGGRRIINKKKQQNT